MREPLLFIPGPVTVPPAVLDAMQTQMIDHRGPPFGELVRRIIAGLRPVFGTKSGEIFLLSSSGTGGLEAAIVNAFSPGDRILATPVGAFGQRMIEIGKSYGLQIEVLENPIGSRAPSGRACGASSRRISKSGTPVFF